MDTIQANKDDDIMEIQSFNDENGKACPAMWHMTNTDTASDFFMDLFLKEQTKSHIHPRSASFCAVNAGCYSVNPSKSVNYISGDDYAPIFDVLTHNTWIPSHGIGLHATALQAVRYYFTVESPVMVRRVTLEDIHGPDVKLVIFNNSGAKIKFYFGKSAYENSFNHRYMNNGRIWDHQRGTNMAVNNEQRDQNIIIIHNTIGAMEITNGKREKNASTGQFVNEAIMNIFIIDHKMFKNKKDQRITSNDIWFNHMKEKSGLPVHEKIVCNDNIDDMRAAREKDRKERFINAQNNTNNNRRSGSNSNYNRKWTK